MADTIRQKILDNMKTTLEGITVAAGYANDVNVQEWQQKGNDLEPAATTPVIVINMGPEEKEHKPSFIINCILDVVLDVWVISPANTETKLNSLLGDIEKILAIDHTRGGYAENTHLINAVTFETVRGQPYAGITITVKIKYKHSSTDPTSQ